MEQHKEAQAFTCLESEIDQDLAITRVDQEMKLAFDRWADEVQLSTLERMVAFIFYSAGWRKAREGR